MLEKRHHKQHFGPAAQPAAVKLQMETKRLIIRPWERQDLSLYHEMSLDIGYNCFAPPGRFLVRDEAEARQKIAARMRRFAKHRIGKFPLFLKDSGIFIGTCGFDFFNLDGRPEVELGTRILLKHWRNGYAREAKTRLIQYAFESLDRDRIFFFCLPQNEQPIRTNLKLGFERLRSFEKNGSRYDLFELRRP